MSWLFPASPLPLNQPEGSPAYGSLLVAPGELVIQRRLAACGCVMLQASGRVASPVPAQRIGRLHCHGAQCSLHGRVPAFQPALRRRCVVVRAEGPAPRVLVSCFSTARHSNVYQMERCEKRLLDVCSASTGLEWGMGSALPDLLTCKAAFAMRQPG